MKILCEKEGAMWKVVFKADTIDPSGMSVVGNFNNWEIKHASAFSDSKALTLLLPGSLNELSFKFYDNVYDCWCEVYDNGELYSGLESYFVRNEVGTTNIVVPLRENETSKKTLRKKTTSTVEETPKLNSVTKNKKKPLKS